MFLTTRGLVLREAKYKESDKILTILTAEEGKLTVKARGVARTRSKISAATQLYGYAEFTLFGNRGMWTVNEAESIEQFRPLREDIKRLALAGYICEMLEAVSDEDCPEPEMLQLGLNCLYALSNKLATRDVVKAVFELRLMCIAGYRPELEACAGCGRVEMDGGVLVPEHGELYCDGCRQGGGLKLDRSVLSAMRYIVNAGPKKIFAFELDDAAEERLASVCEAYALHELDRPFRSLDYYNSIKDTENDATM